MGLRPLIQVLPSHQAEAGVSLGPEAKVVFGSKQPSYPRSTCSAPGALVLKPPKGTLVGFRRPVVCLHFDPGWPVRGSLASNMHTHSPSSQDQGRVGSGRGSAKPEPQAGLTRRETNTRMGTRMDEACVVRAGQL